MVQQENKEVKTTPESTVRYQKMLNNFKAMQDIDKYTGNTYIDRKFNDDMEVALQDVEKLFDEFLSATELKEIGKTISKRLGRKLEAYDIWYDGFKARSNLDETKLDVQTQALYPDAAAFGQEVTGHSYEAGIQCRTGQLSGRQDHSRCRPWFRACLGSIHERTAVTSPHVFRQQE